MAFQLDKETGKIIDPERNIRLIGAGGLSDGIKLWEIEWGEKRFEFKAKDSRAYGGAMGNTPIGVHWFVASMKIPENLKGRRAEIIKIIEESLKAKWKLSGWEGEATIEFDSRLIR